MANPDGTPIWFELSTVDAAAATPFYEAVAGWQVAPSPNPEHGGYLLAGPDQANGVAGLMTARPGMPTGWTVYLAVGDVDATATRIASLGGTVHAGPMDIPGVGRFAAVADPQGVAFSIMAGSGADYSRAFVAAEPGSDASVGHAVWIELATPDPDAAFAFYGALFGWERAGAMPMGPMGDYAFIGAGDARPGAVMSSAATGAPACWSWYVHVADIDAAVAAAKDAGGSLRQGPDEIPGGSFSAKVIDAQGSPIGLVGPRAAGTDSAG